MYTHIKFCACIHYDLQTLSYHTHIELLIYIHCHTHTHTHNVIAVAPPAPKDYNILLDQYQPFPLTTSANTVAFNFTSNPMFNIIYAITAYKIRPLYGHGNEEIAQSNNLSRSLNDIECPPLCSIDEPCRCTGLEVGRHVTVAISAINCGNQEGPAIEVIVTSCKPSNKLNSDDFVAEFGQVQL